MPAWRPPGVDSRSSRRAALEGKASGEHNHRGSVDERSRGPEPARRGGHRRRRRRRLAHRRARAPRPRARGGDDPARRSTTPGSRLADVDGVCHAGIVDRPRRVPRHPPPFTDSHVHRRVELRGARRARRRGDRRRALRGRGGRLRVDAPASDRDRGAAVPRSAAGGPTRRSSGRLPYGLRLPMGPYALAASRHMAIYGTTSEQLAQIAVEHPASGRRMNPRARYRDPLTVDDVLASPMQSSPLHQLDCCLVTDGAGRVRDDQRRRGPATCAKPPVYVLGAGTCHDHSMISQMPDLTTTPGAVSGPAAFRMAGDRARRRRRAHGLRQLHHHRAPAPRGPRLLRQGRRRRLRGGRQARPGWRAAR